jgi:hypothetical protein
MWVEAYLGVTENRLIWALPKSREAGVAQIAFDRVVKYVDQEPGLVGVTSRDPEYAAMLNDPTNPHGETDAAFRFDGYDPRSSTAIRAQIQIGVRSRGKAQPASPSDYLPG